MPIALPMRYFRAGLALALTVSCIGQVAATAPEQGHPVEQSFFNPDDRPDPFENSAPLPPDAVRALLATKEARDVFSDAPRPIAKDPATLFRAVRINVSKTGDTDYLVNGISPLTGGDSEWFWIVRSVGGRSRVLLFTNGYSVELLRHWTNGFRDIRSKWNSPDYINTRIYRFDGTRYRLHYDKWKPFHPSL